MRTELYIDGKWVKGSSTTPVYDPADGSVIADVHLANDELCEAALKAAHNAQAECGFQCCFTYIPIIKR